jgi:hypothetical protein
MTMQIQAGSEPMNLSSWADATEQSMNFFFWYDQGDQMSLRKSIAQSVFVKSDR